jgi:hypothetical protein
MRHARNSNIASLPVAADKPAGLPGLAQNLTVQVVDVPGLGKRVQLKTAAGVILHDLPRERLQGSGGRYTLRLDNGRTLQLGPQRDRGRA